jgi:hypothetical protein
VAHHGVAGNDALAPGEPSIKIDFADDDGGIGKGGTATISGDGKEVEGTNREDGTGGHLTGRRPRCRRGYRHTVNLS